MKQHLESTKNKTKLKSYVAKENDLNWSPTLQGKKNEVIKKQKKKRKDVVEEIKESRA